MKVISHMHVDHMITDEHYSLKHPVCSTQGLFSKYFILMLVVIWECWRNTAESFIFISHNKAKLSKE